MEDLANRKKTRNKAGARPTKPIVNHKSILKTLIISHSHPKLSKGGAEIAAYQHYTELKSRAGNEVFFLASGTGRVLPRDGVIFSQPFGKSEFLYSSYQFNHFIHSNPQAKFYREFDDLLDEINPDVVHFHHYTNFGVEALWRIKQRLPAAIVVVTLHEYLAICHSYGQMVKSGSFSLCYEATPRDCSKCFPNFSPQDFFLREGYIKRFFDYVDAFVSPSQFLADRYLSWGLPPDKMYVIENGMPDAGMPIADRSDLISSPIKLGFFGQISVLKGIDVVMEAARILEGELPNQAIFEIYGDYKGQPPEFREKFEKSLETAPTSFVFMGPYDNSRVIELMRAVDAVLVPSIWWENSPLVIQEAKKARTPIISSNIGGMSEKVRDGVDGLNFQVGSPVSLARSVKRLLQEPELLSTLRDNMGHPVDLRDTVTKIKEIYETLLLRQ